MGQLAGVACDNGLVGLIGIVLRNVHLVEDRDDKNCSFAHA